MKPERGKRFMKIFLSLFFFFLVLFLEVGWCFVSVLSLRFLIVLGDGREAGCWGSPREMVVALRGHPARGSSAPCPASPSASHCLGWLEREENTLANSFCAGNAAVCVCRARHTVAALRGGRSKANRAPADNAGTGTEMSECS